jgi:hypothetical protein
MEGNALQTLQAYQEVIEELTALDPLEISNVFLVANPQFVNAA